MLQTFFAILSVSLGTGQIGIANSEPPADLVGRWLMEGTSPAASERCGARSVKAELLITKKITARAYRGTINSQETYENCPGTRTLTSGLTLRVRDNAISIEYDEDGWHKDSLLLQGDTMIGADKGGTQTTWTKQLEDLNTEPEIDLAALDEYLASLAPEYTKALRSEFGATMLQNLRRTGLSREESIEVATNTLDRMTECVLGLVRDEVLAKSIPVETLKRDPGAVKMLKPAEVDYRKVPCVHDAASNAGVMIY